MSSRFFSTEVSNNLLTNAIRDVEVFFYCRHPKDCLYKTNDLFNRFGFESSESPPSLFGPDQDVKRVDAIDAEIRASGITRQDEKELLIRLSKNEEDSDNEDESSIEDSSEGENRKEDVDDVKSEQESHEDDASPDDIEFLKKEVDRSTAAAMNKIDLTEKENKSRNINSEVIDANLSALDINCKTLNQNYDTYGEDIQTNSDKVSSNVTHQSMDCHSIARGPSSRYAPSSVASTIAPEVIKARVKASLEKRKRNQQMKRIRTKGDTSAVTRQRNENKNEIKTSTDAFWAD